MGTHPVSGCVPFLQTDEPGSATRSHKPMSGRSFGCHKNAVVTDPRWKMLNELKPVLIEAFGGDGVVRGGSRLKPTSRRGGGVLEGFRKTAGASEAAMGDLDAPSEPDEAEHRLLVIPPDPAHLQVMAPAEHAGSGRGDPTVHQDQLKPPGDPLLGQVLD